MPPPPTDTCPEPFVRSSIACYPKSREQGELWETACGDRQHLPVLGAKGHASVSQNVALSTQSDTVNRYYEDP